MKKILFLCTGNSCRSIMAEALMNHLGQGLFTAQSAGSHPAGYVHKGSLDCLERHKIPHDGLHSKSWDVFENETFDIVVTVCNDAAEEVCPVYIGQHTKLHWPTPDPAKVEAGLSRSQPVFDEAFNFLKKHIEALIKDSQN